MYLDQKISGLDTTWKGLILLIALGITFFAIALIIPETQYFYNAQNKIESEAPNEFLYFVCVVLGSVLLFLDAWLAKYLFSDAEKNYQRDRATQLARKTRTESEEAFSKYSEAEQENQRLNNDLNQKITRLNELHQATNTSLQNQQQQTIQATQIREELEGKLSDAKEAIKAEKKQLETLRQKLNNENGRLKRLYGDKFNPSVESYVQVKKNASEGFKWLRARIFEIYHGRKSENLILHTEIDNQKKRIVIRKDTRSYTKFLAASPLSEAEILEIETHLACDFEIFLTYKTKSMLQFDPYSRKKKKTTYKSACDFRPIT